MRLVLVSIFALASFGVLANQILSMRKSPQQQMYNECMAKHKYSTQHNFVNAYAIELHCIESRHK